MVIEREHFFCAAVRVVAVRRIVVLGEQCIDSRMEGL